MKYRGSFVANSSSSSFIIGSPELINSPQDIIEHWFNGRTDDVPYPFTYDEFKPYTMKEIAEFCSKNFARIVINFDELDDIMAWHSNPEKDWRDMPDFDEVLEDIVSRTFLHCRYETEYRNEAFEEAYNKKFRDEAWSVDSHHNREQFMSELIQENVLPEIKELIYSKVNELKKYPHIYQGEIEDDTTFEAGLEHNEVLWDLVPFKIKICHH